MAVIVLVRKIAGVTIAVLKLHMSERVTMLEVSRVIVNFQRAGFERVEPREYQAAVNELRKADQGGRK